MGRGRHLTQIPASSTPLRAGTRASLFGGLADGRVVEVQFVEDPVAVYLSRASQLVALAADAPAPGGEFLGIYELAGGRGPEQPVLVYRVGARRP